MKLLDVHDAIGEVLAHDLTQIIPGEFKGARFKKGYKISKNDIELLLDMGKRNVYVIDKEEDDMHEDEAARLLAEAIIGPGMGYEPKNEGKAELIAEQFGVLKIDLPKLYEAVAQDKIIISTIHQNQVVAKGDVCGVTRVMPLYVSPDLVNFTISILEKPSANPIISGNRLMSIRPIGNKKVGIVTTGNEVYTGRIEDRFGPVLRGKFDELNTKVVGQVFCDDDEHMIADAIRDFIDQGVDLVCTTGGMSVDPDDRTPTGIRLLGGEIISHGAPVIPGAMCMLAVVKGVPVVGLPGCVMYAKRTIFDLIVPRILADDIPSIEEINMLAHGGFCRACDICVYPICPFGKA